MKQLFWTISQFTLNFIIHFLQPHTVWLCRIKKYCMNLIPAMPFFLHLIKRSIKLLTWTIEQYPSIVHKYIKGSKSQETRMHFFEQKGKKNQLWLVSLQYITPHNGHVGGLSALECLRVPINYTWTHNGCNTTVIFLKVFYNLTIWPKGFQLRKYSSSCIFLVKIWLSDHSYYHWALKGGNFLFFFLFSTPMYLTVPPEFDFSPEIVLLTAVGTYWTLL